MALPHPDALAAFLVPIAIGVVGASIAAYFSLRSNRLRRLMADLPTSKTTGVFVGFNELKGSATCLSPLTSYLAGRECVHYRYDVSEHWSRTVTESYTDSNGRRRTRTRRESGWKTVASGGDTTTFFLDDGHGQILVRPTGAEIEALPVFSQVCGRGHPLYYSKGPQHSVFHSDHRRRFSESAIPVGASLYILGQAQERHDIVAAEIAMADHAPKFLISTRTEEEIAGGKRAKTALLGLLGAFFAGAGAAIAYTTHGGDPPPAAIAIAVGIYALVWLAGWGVGVLNSIIGLRNRARQAYSLIDVQLKRRADLIPQLVELARASAAHEKGLNLRLAEIRSGATEAIDTFRRRSPQLLALAEKYPQLATGDAFLQLQEELAETEDRIALARGYYNEMASFLNTRRQTVPDGWFAKIARVREFDLYEA